MVKFRQLLLKLQKFLLQLLLMQENKQLEMKKN